MSPPETLTEKEVKAHFDRAGLAISTTIVLAVLGDRMYKREGNLFHLLDNGNGKDRATDEP